MNATTGGRETRGIVADTLRRPIKDAVREGVEEAMRDQRVTVKRRKSERSEDEGGRGWGWLLALAIVGLGVAFVVRRRRSGGSGDDHDQWASDIRERSKTTEGLGSPGGDVSMGGSVETGEENVEDENAEGATPGSHTEDD